jgi:hypothetical protein
MISAAFTVNGASNPAAHSVSYGSTVNLVLQSYSGATSIVWTIIGCSDPDETLPTITASGAPSGQTASFVMPADSGDDLGRAFLVKCEVSSEIIGSSGVRESSTEYAVIGAPNIQGIIPIAPGEENYRHGTHGWGPEINIALANSASGASGDVVGPASSVASRIAVFSGTSGKLLADGGMTIAEAIAAASGGSSLNAPTDPGDDGKVAIADSGDLIYSLIASANISPTAAITLSQLANISTSTILGRITSGTGVIESLTVSGGVEFSGTGIRRSALTGDVTASAGSNATTIANNAVTFAKFQTLNTDKFVGRDSAGTGNAEEIGVTGGIEFTGTGNIQRSAISGDITISAGSSTSAITSNVIVNDDINTNAGIVLSKLATQAALSVVANGTNGVAVPTAMAATADADVFRRSGTTLGWGKLVTASISDSQITFAKIQNITTDKILGRDSASTGVVEEIGVTGGLEFTGTGNIQRSAISGDIIIAAGSNTASYNPLSIVDGDISTVASIALTKLANGTAASVVCRAGSTSGVHSDLASLNDGEVLTRVGGQLVWAFLDFQDSIGGTVPINQLETIAGLTLLGNNTNTPAGVVSITSTLDHQIMRRNGTTINWGSIDLSQSAAVGSSKLSFNNIQNIATDRIVGRDTTGTGVLEELTVTGGLEFNGAGIQRSALTGAISASAGSNTTAFASGNFGSLNITTTGSGSFNGITNTGAYAGGTTPATTGIIRLPNANSIRFRNAANSADVDALTVDSSNLVVIGNSSDTAITLNDSADTINLRTAGAIQLAIDSSSIDAQDNNIVTTGNLRVGTTPASSGQIRIPSATAIAARNNANSGDLNLVSTNSSDDIILGNSSDTAVLINNSSDLITLKVANSNVLTVSSTVSEFLTQRIRFDSTVASPGILQEDDATGSITGDTLIINAQNATGVTATGGELHLRSGTGTTANGVLRLYNGATNVMSIFSTAVQISNAPNIVFDSAVVSPGIGHNTDSTATVTGDTFTINAQDCSGTTSVTAGAMTIRAGNATGGSGTRNGGALTLSSGTGSTSDGNVFIKRGSTTGIQIVKPSSGLVVGLAKTSTITSSEMGANTGDGVVYIPHATTPPSANPLDGGILYYKTGGYAGLSFRTINGVNGFGDSSFGTHIYGAAGITFDLNLGVQFLMKSDGSLKLPAVASPPSPSVGDAIYYRIGQQQFTTDGSNYITIG